LDKNVLNINYSEVPVNGTLEYFHAVSANDPQCIIYNYYPATMAFLNKSLINQFPRAKHIAIIHDPLDPGFIAHVEEMFDAWIIHDHTNPIESVKKFKTFRPIPRFERKTPQSSKLSIGTHGFAMNPWKGFDRILSFVQEEFDEIEINMNIPIATFSRGAAELEVLNNWRSIIKKDNINLNITSEYFEEEEGLINFLSKNTMNIYFYYAPTPFVGVGASGDLAVAAQSSLIVNDSYMYRHFHEKLGYYEQTGKIGDFLNNSDKVKSLYDEWSPEAITEDYKNMIEKV
jgi:hypothetical protein